MGYRIAISLTKYFTDERSYCYLLVDNKYVLVSDLQDYLRNLFDLKGQFCLLNDNFYLPNEENIGVIKDGETVSVIPLKNEWCQEKVNKKQTEEFQEENENMVQTPGTPKPSKKKKKKKHKENSDTVTDDVKNANMGQETEAEKIPLDGVSNITVEVNNDKKVLMDVSVTSDIYDLQRNTSTESSPIEFFDLSKKARIQSNVDSDTQYEHDFKSVLSTEKSTDMQNTLQLLKNKAMTLLIDNASKVVAGVSAGRINKRKRIRKRKNKNANLPTDVSANTEEFQTIFSPVKKTITHIRFTDSEKSPVIIQNDGYDKVRQPEAPRIIRALESDMRLSNQSRSSSLSVSHESLNHQSDFTKTDISKDDQLEEREKDSLEHVDLSSEVDGTFKLTIDALTSDLKSFPLIGTALPVSKDIILFKMFKMDNNYTPTISDYILAHVIEVEESNSTVKLSIIDGHLQCTSPKGKFDITEDEEAEAAGCTALCDEQMVLAVEWGRIVEARLVFP